MINYVHVGGLKDSHGNSVDVSYEANKATMGVGYDNQIGANDCTYWTDYHLAGRYSATDPIMSRRATTITILPVSFGTTEVRATTTSKSRSKELLTAQGSPAAAPKTPR